MKRILIDAPGDGAFIMDRAGRGQFDPDCDHCFATHDATQLLGGFVVTPLLGSVYAIHQAGITTRWCSRDLLWMLFHYVFRQLHATKAIGPILSSNQHAISIVRRGGWKLETVVTNATPQGDSLLLFSMVEADCRWLHIIPQQYQPGPDLGG